MTIPEIVILLNSSEKKQAFPSALMMAQRAAMVKKTPEERLATFRQDWGID